MSRIFIDTSYLVAILSADDEDFANANSLRQKVRTPLLTTEYVLVEFGNATSSPRLRSDGAATIAAIRNDSSTTVVPATTSLMEEGLRLFSRRPDKSWGLTDCISFVVMEREGITEALTADRHFEQAGFKALLRSEA